MLDDFDSVCERLKNSFDKLEEFRERRFKSSKNEINFSEALLIHENNQNHRIRYLDDLGEVSEENLEFPGSMIVSKAYLGKFDIHKGFLHFSNSKSNGTIFIPDSNLEANVGVNGGSFLSSTIIRCHLNSMIIPILYSDELEGNLRSTKRNVKTFEKLFEETGNLDFYVSQEKRK